ncbi:uncharacterized protein BXZ73DRAFT_55176, partial [Epithele typhae]|uniref:uncharacterized protein n=1 Tax=Epithele typhae TaxID=378194 RepID=UPI002007E557
MSLPSFPHVEDVLYPIFLHCEGDRGLLLALAITYRTFTRPALAVLWKTLPNDHPLGALMYTLGISQPRHAEGTEAFSGITDARDFVCRSPQSPCAHPNWKRFCGYACRVQEIGIYPFAAHDRPSVWSDLAHFLDCAPILPALRRVL